MDFTYNERIKYQENDRRLTNSAITTNTRGGVKYAINYNI